ncbi:unnamed protein product [Cyclocybe aegerita]|uniref:Uncharacterized protein n=1 Tax=Cyclocybe aegerita TaxID=1973307 RepID=A0A8S0WTM3_CYCAE|nr:unnamed protein product [Cyclocybe aegerita]
MYATLLKTSKSHTLAINASCMEPIPNAAPRHAGAYAIDLQNSQGQYPSGNVTTQRYRLHARLYGRYPSEIVSQFLVILICIDDSASGTPIRDICLTCGEWCDVGVSTPKLWSCLDINVDSGSSQAMRRWIEKWLERSKRHSLKTSLSISDGPDIQIGGETKRLVNGTFEMLSGQIYQWSELNLLLSNDEPPRSLTYNREKAVQLEKLSIATPPIYLNVEAIG